MGQRRRRQADYGGDETSRLASSFQGATVDEDGQYCFAVPL
jgi:hypothetical protein